MPFRKEYTPEETAAYNERKKKEIEEIIDRIDNGVKAVFGSDKYKEYLKFVSKFTDYSANNTMLIGMQRPDATLVASFGKWKQLGRSVDKGEKGIEILAPVKYKTNQVLEIERPVVDEFGNPVYNEDGTAKTETVEDPMTGLAFKKAYVFDVSQTSGKEIPEPVSELSGDIDAAQKEAIFAALKKVTGVDIHFKDIQSGAKGYYSAVNNEIVIRSGMSDTQTLKTAFHEAAHDLLHDPNKKIVTVKSPRNEKEVQAESVAFIVAEKLGIDTSEYSFPYIASWSDGKQLEQLKNALKEIQEASRQISSAIESELLKLKKRGLSMEEKLYDDDLDNVQKAEFLIEDCSDRNINFSVDDTKKILDFAEKHEDILETVKFVSDMEEIQRQRDSYGYDFTYMTPVDTKEAALEAFDNGEAVYLLYPDNTEGQALERSEIENFDGYFGIEKENTSRTVDDKLIPVSKDVALEMWDVDLDVYIDGKRVSDRSEIINAPDNKKFYLSEYQYAAQLEFEDPKITNTVPVSEKNIIGNTPYRELGDKSELQYYKNLKNRHAENIAAQLNADGIRFSGLKKEWTTTITINKADIPAYEAAVEKVKAGYDKAKNTEKPVEYYAVRQTNDHKFAVCTISADGLVTQVKPNIPTAAEAKKAMLELFEKKKNSVRCEFVHPQILDEKSAGSYKNMAYGLPDTTYRIQVNTRKNDVSDNTHFLQEYIKNPDDTYKVGKVVCKGDFEKCNAALADILKNGMPHLPEKCDESFEIYQLKNGEENRGIRFVSLTELAEQGKRPDFSKYEKTYESDISKMSIRGETVGSKLEAIFVKFNLDRPDDFKGRSLSVSDVVVMNNKAYYVDPKGFQPLKEFKPEEKKISQEKYFVKNKNDSLKKPKI